MRKMKNSGIPWIGEIAEDYEVKKLKYLCDILDDSDFHFGKYQLKVFH